MPINRLAVELRKHGSRRFIRSRSVAVSRRVGRVHSHLARSTGLCERTNNVMTGCQKSTPAFPGHVIRAATANDRAPKPNARFTAGHDKRNLQIRVRGFA